jgi:hypothetical protein
VEVLHKLYGALFIGTHVVLVPIVNQNQNQNLA